VLIEYHKMSRYIESDTYYGCGDHRETSVIQCDPFTNNVETYDITGHSIKLYNATNSKPLLSEGKQGKAAGVDSRYSESIILSDKLNLNSSWFSVSFWLREPSEHHKPDDIISYRCLKCFPPSGWDFGLERVNESLSSVRFNIYNSSGGYLHRKQQGGGE
jgi:hypothetical protein